MSEGADAEAVRGLPSKLDLDDLAHGHPVAERELAELRARVERLSGALREIAALEWNVGLSKSRDNLYIARDLAKDALSPSSGKVPEPFEERHARECPFVAHRPDDTGDCIHGKIRFANHAALMRSHGECPGKCGENARSGRFAGRTCREVYESEKVPAAPGADNSVREEAGDACTPERASSAGTTPSESAALALAAEMDRMWTVSERVTKKHPLACECADCVLVANEPAELSAYRAALRAGEGGK